MSTASISNLTPAEYLARERASESRSEFVEGEVFPMAGASREHNLIAGNIYILLRTHLRGLGCEVYTSDMRVKVEASGLYTYPDVTVVRGTPRFEDANVDTLLNPALIVEVLSESTEDYDRGEKFDHYRGIVSFTDYLLVAQDRHCIEHFVRSPHGQWIRRELTAADGVLEIPSFGCRLSMADVYEDVGFDEA